MTPDTSRRRGAFGTWMVAAATVALGTSAYLTWTKLAGEAPACGPLRGCETVNSSPYSEFFGIPVALFGLVAAGVALAAAAIWWWRSDRRAVCVAYVLGLVSVPVLAYLTYLEIFVIGAVCVWCVAYAAAVVAGWAASLVCLRRVSNGT